MFRFGHSEAACALTNLTVCSEPGLFSLTRLQELGPGHLTFYCFVLNCASSRHIILFKNTSQEYLQHDPTLKHKKKVK